MTKLDKMRLERLELEQRLNSRGFGRHFGTLFSGMVVFSILSCALVLFLAQRSGGQYDLLYALAVIPLVNVVLGLAVRIGGKKWYDRERALVEAIEQAARGDFSVRLEESEAGAWENIYRNFNKMAADLQNHRIINENFVKDFSHELKTPIASIHGFAEVLLTEKVTLEEQRMYLTIIADQSARLADLAQNTLMLSKIDSQQFIMAKNSFALDEQIKQCLILLSSQWEQKQLDFSADLLETAYTGSEELLQQVWINLFSNAIKFTPEGGRIMVTMTRQGEGVRIAVADSGSGMSAETCAHVFEKYYQGDHSRRAQGHGLGLAIVKRIVELHGGCVEVESVLGQGSTFSVYLPLIEAAPTVERPQPVRPQETAFDTREIMVPLELAEIYRACCTSLGWQVINERPADQPGQLLKRWTLVRSQHWAKEAKLQAWQSEAEELLQKLFTAQQQRAGCAMAAAVGLGLASVALCGLGVWYFARQQVWLGLGLFVLGILGCGAAFPLYGWVSRLSAKHQAVRTTQWQQELAALSEQAAAFRQRSEEMRS